MCKVLAPVKVMYEMLQIKIRLYDFSSIKTLSVSKSSNFIMSQVLTRTAFNINFF